MSLTINYRRSGTQYIQNPNLQGLNSDSQSHRKPSIDLLGLKNCWAYFGHWVAWIHMMTAMKIFDQGKSPP